VLCDGHASHLSSKPEQIARRGKSKSRERQIFLSKDPIYLAGVSIISQTPLPSRVHPSLSQQNKRSPPPTKLIANPVPAGQACLGRSVADGRVKVTTWLPETRRVLWPGGIVAVTVMNAVRMFGGEMGSVVVVGTVVEVEAEEVSGAGLLVAEEVAGDPGRLMDGRVMEDANTVAIVGVPAAGAPLNCAAGGAERAAEDGGGVAAALVAVAGAEVCDATEGSGVIAVLEA